MTAPSGSKSGAGPKREAEVRAALEAYFRGLLEALGEPHARLEWLDEAEAEAESASGERRAFALNLQGVEALRRMDVRAIDALAYLAEIAVRRRTGVAVRLRLDVNRQRARRLEELKQLALRWAEQARLENRPIELEPMEAQERKAIHEALSRVRGVRTYSKGKGPDRRVVIEPVPEASDADEALEARS